MKWLLNLRVYVMKVRLDFVEDDFVPLPNKHIDASDSLGLPGVENGEENVKYLVASKRALPYRLIPAE